MIIENVQKIFICPTNQLLTGFELINGCVVYMDITNKNFCVSINDTGNNDNSYSIWIEI